jgi:methylated-DNA-[protein]-cysteine S-methyltransferase
VWDALYRIPFGETRSYQEIACEIGRPKASRAVGMACHVNPVVIAVPCHRVIGKNGSLTGFGGGIDKKSYLLEFEKGQTDLQNSDS